MAIAGVKTSYSKRIVNQNKFLDDAQFDELL